MTIAPDLLHTLARTHEGEAEVSRDSMFVQEEENRAKKEEAVNSDRERPKSAGYLNNYTAYREAFTRSDGGKGEEKTKQVSCPPLSETDPSRSRLSSSLLISFRIPKAIDIFSEYQRKAEALMRANHPSAKE